MGADSRRRGQVPDGDVLLQEDQAYDFTLTGPNGFEKHFTGMLDCKTQGSTSGITTQTVGEPSPALASADSTGGTNLAETGGSARPRSSRASPSPWS